MLHNLGSKSYLGTLLACDSRTASANGTGFDLEGSNGAEGEAIIILSSDAASAGTDPTLDVKLQESSDNSDRAAEHESATLDRRGTAYITNRK